MNEISRRDERLQNISWKTVARPGYLGKRKDEMYRVWNEEYGEGNWRIVNETRGGEIVTYKDMVLKVYAAGYAAYFESHPAELAYITENYSYGYDKDLVDKNMAFDIYALYNKPGVANQFHHVAFNIAIEVVLGVPFKGNTPIQVREGKPGTPEDQQPNGYKWSPGRIPCLNPQAISEPHIPGWWNADSIEDFYQSTKALQVKM